ncbi:hypothetical protein LSTR_LSTR008246 [Laodelphax striatellus]|uniref:Bromodomain associated domain-containing protein n=1 Tax=Laodelphax striatellus TaxID=195883 RepID=A0A482XL94_LAOST|nr:hypothetical protein LSTR_LSTR008246 [Laodelphax striatellus]
MMWGDIPSPKVEWEKIVPKELGDLVIVSAVKTEKPEVLYPPPDEESNVDIVIPPEYSNMESTVTETIQLIQYGRRVKKLIDKVEELQDNYTFENIEPCPPFPESPEKKSRPPLFHKPDSPLVKKEETPSPISLDKQRLSSKIVQKILEKTVAALIAHAGFDTAMDSALRVLTDAADDFLKTMTMLLRNAVDQEMLCAREVYPDAVERVFSEMGLGSVRCLGKFYQNRVLDYREEVYKESKKLAEQYQNQYSIIQASFQTKELPPYTKFEKDDDTDIPKINFLAVGDADDIDELQPSLQPGFQMLETFEQMG